MRPAACGLGRPCVVVLLLAFTWIWCFHAQGATEPESRLEGMYVHTQADLIAVLGRPDVSTALLANNIRLDTEGWPAQPLVRNSSLLIIASASWGDRQPLFDFNFIGNRVILRPGVVLEFRDVELRCAGVNVRGQGRETRDGVWRGTQQRGFPCPLSGNALARLTSQRICPTAGTPCGPHGSSCCFSALRRTQQCSSATRPTSGLHACPWTNSPTPCPSCRWLPATR